MTRHWVDIIRCISESSFNHDHVTPIYAHLFRCVNECHYTQVQEETSD